ncbi:hypothetical protein PAMC26577_16095 [Caballeronia sordidicola]|uniref:Uncharacterized protein n=1 Tax=Caballeronia sordidicola TaxID=196367 RepID=A0A242MTA2_CABSO|nr:hypothetical protein PAMC26577_16095 [Caballeronia sordidicola]
MPVRYLRGRRSKVPGRSGRRLRLKVGEIKVEATTRQEFEQ